MMHSTSSQSVAMDIDASGSKSSTHEPPQLLPMTDDREGDSSDWSVGLYGGTEIRWYCACLVAALLPCVGVGHTVRDLYGRIAGCITGIFFSGALIASIVFLVMFVAIAKLRATAYTYSSIYDYVSKTYTHWKNPVPSSATMWRYLWLSCAAVLLYVVGVALLRFAVRLKFHIRGSPMRDLVTSCCCCCCTVAQMRTHVKLHKKALKKEKKRQEKEAKRAKDTLPAYDNSHLQAPAMA